MYDAEEPGVLPETGRLKCQSEYAQWTIAMEGYHLLVAKDRHFLGIYMVTSQRTIEKLAVSSKERMTPQSHIV